MSTSSDGPVAPGQPHPLWRLAAFGLVAGACGYLVRSLLTGRSERQRRGGSKTTRVVAHDVGRWENEGGMVATKVPAATARDPDHVVSVGPA